MKNKLMAVICLACFVILAVYSSILTGNFFKDWAGVASGEMGILSFIVGIAMDAGKFVFPLLAGYKIANNKFVGCLVYSFLTIVCVLFSFSASMAYDLNLNNKITNDTIQESSGYKRQETVYQSTQESIIQLRKDIENMKKNRDKNIQEKTAGLVLQRESARKKNWITTPKTGVNAIQVKIDAIISGIDKEITDKETALNNAEGNLLNVNSGFSTAGKDAKETKGLKAFATWLSPKDPEGMIGKLNMVKNIFIEFFAIAFSLGFGYLVSKSGNNETGQDHDNIDSQEPREKESFLNRWFGSNKKPGNQDYTKPKEAKKQNNIIGFKHEPSEILSTVNEKKEIEEALRIYAGTIFPGVKENNDRCLGLDSVFKTTGYDRNKLLKAKSHLEHSGALYVKGNSTYVKNIEKLESYI